MTRYTDRIYHLFGGLMMIAGTLLFLAGGRLHPLVNDSLGEVGSDEFYRAFAAELLAHPNWAEIHGQLLAGPLLWTLGALALADLCRRAGEKRWSTLGIVALAMGAVFWVIVFVFDGFVSPVIAEALLQGDSTAGDSFITQFAASQLVVIRTSLVSWILIGFGMVALAVSLAITAPRLAPLDRMFSLVLVVTGLVLGLWPLVGWFGGTFEPGPLTSPWWSVTALTTALWFGFTGLAVMLRQRLPGRADAEPSPAALAMR